MVTDVMPYVERYGVKYPKPYKYKVKKIKNERKVHNNKRELKHGLYILH